jgi:hypothetical protein
MIEEIKRNLHNPEVLETMYRNDKKAFELSFGKVYPEIEDSEAAKFWKTRLEYDKPAVKISGFRNRDLLVMIAACLITGFLIKLPALFNFNLSEFLFYERNAGIIVFSGLIIYYLWVNKTFEMKKLAIAALGILIPLLYVNVLPVDKNSNSINLVYFHLPVLMWCMYGITYIGFDLRDNLSRMEYIRHNGDLAVLGAIILLAGGVVTAVTIGLFSAIGISIEKIYMNNVVVVGLASAPIVATFILKNYASLISKIAPLIANLFSPVVLITLFIYLISMAFAGKDPYNDRNFLMIFNIMLIGVMAIIVFSVTGTSREKKQRLSEMTLFLLSIVTLIVDVIALSAIFYRMGNYGITPNRLAVLGSNILIFINLILIMMDLYKVNFRKAEIEKVGLTISKYLPVYFVWIIFVVFGFPLIFAFR